MLPDDERWPQHATVPLLTEDPRFDEVAVEFVHRESSQRLPSPCAASLAAAWRSLAIADYATATERFEQLAGDRACGTDEAIAAAASNGLALRLAIGPIDRAVEDAEMILTIHGRSDGELSGRIAASLASGLERRRDWRALVRRSRRYLAQNRRRGPLHQILRALVEAAIGYRELGRRDPSRRWFEVAARLGESGLDRGAIGESPCAAHRGDLAACRTAAAVAEARFQLAETLFDRYRRIRDPRYEGNPCDERRRQSWILGPLTRWFRRTRSMLWRAERAYRRVLELNLPNWTMAAAARVGQLHARGGESIRTLELPSCPPWAEPGGGSEADFYFFAAAEDAFGACLGFARATRGYGAWSETCAAELDRLGRSRYPPLEEIYDRRFWIADDRVQRNAPVPER